MLHLTPGFLRFHGAATAQALQLYGSLRDNATLPPGVKLPGQARAQARLLLHAYQYAPFWRQRLNDAGFNPQDPQAFDVRQLPELTREDLRQAGSAMRARWPNCAADKIFTVTTSGSTGQPVQVEKHVDYYFSLDQALALLEMDWFQRDPTKSIAYIGPQVADSVLPTWGGIYEALGYRGAYYQRNFLDKPMESHLDWLAAVRPAYLKCSPHLAVQLASRALSTGQTVPVDQLISMSESVSPRQRLLCHQGFGAKIVDRYSTEETGMIALQCPHHDHLHVIDSAVVLEIVDDAGALCPPGRVGRVLVTALTSFAQPIIRYDVGDLAEYGSCDCGITMPVIKRVWGRTRTSIKVPGRGLIPMGFIGDDLGEIRVIQSFRLRQYDDAQLELELVVERPLSAAEQQEVAGYLRGYGLTGMTLCLAEKTQIDWPKDQKRQEFVQVHGPLIPQAGHRVLML